MIRASRNSFIKIRARWLIFSIAVGLVAAACSTGSYPVDVFTMMHYQQSYKSQEPPRLTPREGAVPFTEESEPLRSIEPASLEEALATVNPVPRTSETEDQGRRIFIRNCSMCHGLNGRGESPVADAFRQLNVSSVPANFTTAGSVSPNNPNDGLAFWTITNGVNNMPSFRYLLTQEERWTVIHYLRVLAEQGSQ